MIATGSFDLNQFNSEENFMKMPRRLFLGLTLAISCSTAAQAACSGEDLRGGWYAQYRINNPRQVGECAFDLRSSSPVVGLCDNLTYGFRVIATYARWTMRPNCNFTMTVNFDDGQVMTAKGRLNGNLSFASGNLTSRASGRTYKGRFSIWRVLQNSSLAENRSILRDLEKSAPSLETISGSDGISSGFKKFIGE